MKTATGRLQMHRDGYGFVIPEPPLEGIQGDIFIPPDSAQSAMHGDQVVAQIVRLDQEGRAEGRILKVLGRAHPTVVGEFRVGPRGNYVVPHDERIRQHIRIPEGLEIPPPAVMVDRLGVRPLTVSEPAELDGMIVNVEVLEFPTGREDAVGRVIEILGRPEDFGVDVEIIIRKHHLPHRFPPEVLAQAQSFSSTIHAEELAGRTDFRGMDVVTIDPETAQDFDDAVWVDRAPSGNYLLHVHIADVSHYVRPGTPIDLEARLRGTSVYFPDRAIPMLPLELSTELCSLKPRLDRLVLSVLLEIDHRGDVVSQQFVPGVIRSVERMTYSNVYLVLEGDPGQCERYRNLADRFALMRELALILDRKRVRRGSIDFDLPEPLIEFDEWGEMIGVTRAPRNIAHRIIEEFMLAANEAVASHLARSGAPALYRIHEAPEEKRVLEFEELAARFGYSLGAARPLSSRNYQRLLHKLEGKPEERILNYLMLRSLKQARYSAENLGHFALAASAYTHFTSPIRRYPDLTVHRIIRGQATCSLVSLAEDCSQTERRAAEAERELVEWKKLRFMAERLGDEFKALIISTARFGFFVELEDLFVEGLVPIDSLPGDRYGYHENTRKIVGLRTRREFAIGDQVRVLLARVDAVERKLHFSLV